MKGQLTIQYLASFIFFIGLIIYIYFSYSANIPRFIEEVEKENVRSKAYQLSEILVNDPGYPVDWNKAETDSLRIGFSDHNVNKTNLILLSKVYEFQNEFDCTNGFDKVQKCLALDKPFSFYIFNVTDDGEREPLLECVPSMFPMTTINATIKRITAFNDTTIVPKGEMGVAELIVQM